VPFPVDEKYIANTENELGVKFPDSFRKKMMKSNGGGVEVSMDYFEIHPFYDTSDKKRIKRTCNSILYETKIAREHYRLPESLIVIGNNGAARFLPTKLKKRAVIMSNHPGVRAVS
jgi:hypothetical protein